eukprot:738274-Prorocentrum_minimum.AAC.3
MSAQKEITESPSDDEDGPSRYGEEPTDASRLDESPSPPRKESRKKRSGGMAAMLQVTAPLKLHVKR